MPVQSMDINFSSVLSIVHKSWNASGPLVAEIALKKKKKIHDDGWATLLSDQTKSLYDKFH